MNRWKSLLTRKFSSLRSNETIFIDQQTESELNENKTKDGGEHLMIPK